MLYSSRYPLFDLTSRLLVKPTDLSIESSRASPEPISDAMYYTHVK